MRHGLEEKKIFIEHLSTFLFIDFLFFEWECSVHFWIIAVPRNALRAPINILFLFSVHFIFIYVKNAN